MDAKDASRLKSFVKESLVENLVFGNPETDHAIEQAIWRSGFGTEEDASKLCGLLHPETQVRLTYDIIQMGAALYTAAIVPWRLAFNQLPVLWSVAFFFDAMIDAIFIFDLVLNFFVYTCRGC